MRMAIDQREIRPSNQQDNELIHQSLRSYNRQYMRDFRDYSFHIQDGDKLIAGIVAGSTLDTLEIEFLFVDATYRREKLGSQLLFHVESLARRDGLRRILLNTYSFQAPGFYEKHGYSQLLRISPCFGDFSQYYFEKNL